MMVVDIIKPLLNTNDVNTEGIFKVLRTSHTGPGLGRSGDCDEHSVTAGQ